MLKKGLDRDLGQIVRVAEAGRTAAPRMALIGVSALFLVIVWLFAGYQAEGLSGGAFIILAAVVGGYMALNIGANDVANNMGPAVGARALTMPAAVLIAAVCEAAGALLAGGDVVSTIKSGIIDPTRMDGDVAFIEAMIAALLAAALWINLATWLKAPVSTTHSIVGGVLGGGLAAAGPSIVDWTVIGKIVASWIVSPLLGGVIAALFLALCKALILDAQDRIAAARRWVPVLVAIMAGTFTVYLAIKGLKQVWRPDATMIALLTVAVAALFYLGSRPLVARAAAGLADQRKRTVAQLFLVPLVVAAALLSFAHGANDVANAVGPLAAVVDVARGGAISGKAGIPIWVMLVGALGLAVGLALFGPKLIAMVGQEITRLNPMRAFCVALSAAVTVILASALGLPVSSTHIAIGGIFGVGLFREWRANRRRGGPASEPLRAAFGREPLPQGLELPVAKREARQAKAERRRLVRRTHAYTIVAAWIITVPAAAGLAALLFLAMHHTLG